MANSIEQSSYPGHIISKLYISYDQFKNKIMNNQIIYFVAHEIYAETPSWAPELPPTNYDHYYYYFINSNDCIFNIFDNTVSIAFLGVYKESGDGTYLERIERSIQSVEELGPTEPDPGGGPLDPGPLL